jgi:dimeric dUTPase (all-alpha-NTP-PPase superfamily)
MGDRLRESHGELDYDGGVALLRHRLQGAHAVWPPKDGVLQIMLDEQRSVLDVIQERLGESDLPAPLRLVEMADAIMMEAAELKAWLPWKRWKGDYGRELTDEEEAGVIEELVDILHFLLEALLIVGVESEHDLGALYLAKAAVNKKRQEDGY